MRLCSNRTAQMLNEVLRICHINRQVRRKSVPVGNASVLLCVVQASLARKMKLSVSSRAATAASVAGAGRGASAEGASAAESAPLLYY